MKGIKNYQKVGLLSALAGTALFIYLIHRTGPSIILANIRFFGANFILLILASGARHYLRTAAWHYCIEDDHRRISFLNLFNIRLAGDAIADLTFPGPFLGETAKAFVVAQRMPAAYSLSSIVIENLIYSLSVALFITSGVLILLLKFAMPQQIRIASIIAGLGILLPVLAVGVAINHRWMPLSKFLDRLKERNVKWSFLERQEEKIRLFEETVYGFYGKHRGLFFYILFVEMLTNFTGVIEAYLILNVTTGHSSVLGAFIIEAVNRSVNVIFAFIPLRVGVDEGGMALTLNALGYGAAEGVSLAVIRKIRTLFWVGVGLLIIARYSLADKRAGPSEPSVMAATKEDEEINCERG